jgi:peptidoglycan hydrolase-like protein with peptidoglycan-binding domain
MRRVEGGAPQLPILTAPETNVAAAQPASMKRALDLTASLPEGRLFADLPTVPGPAVPLRPVAQSFLRPGILKPAVGAVLAGAAFFSFPGQALADLHAAPLSLETRPAYVRQDDRAAVFAQRPRLERGVQGPAVRVLQQELAALGYPVGEIDANFGRQTRGALAMFQRVNGLTDSGRTDQLVWRALASGRAMRMPAIVRYAPRSDAAIALFRQAAPLAGVPESWARSPALHSILQAESDGIVGRPNYTYGPLAREDISYWPGIHRDLRRGVIRARSSATGLGQLLLDNVERFYPSGRNGIGNALEEAVGMLAYIKDRYGSPERAWELYGQLHEGY